MRRQQRALRVLVATLALATCAVPASQATAQEPFYKGRTITIICGFAAGGGYDTYARLLARHIVDHIPGRPTAVVQNMEGAGSVRAANHVYANTPRDGTVIAAVNQNMPLYQLLGGKSAQFEAGKLQWIGSLISSNGAIYVWHTSPTVTIEDARRRDTVVGGAGTNSDSYIYPMLVNKLAGTRFKIINGYAGGTKDLHLAMERGEIEGRGGGGSIPSLAANNRDWLEQKKVRFLVQLGLTADPEMAGAPLLGDLVSSEDDKRIVELVVMPTILGYAYWLAPGVPADRIDMLRSAFDAMLADPAFKADAEKGNIIVTPKPGRDIEALVTRAATTPAPVLDRAARLLEWKD